MSIAVGAYEAKVRFSELLRGIKAGKRYAITNHGAAVADLVPSERAAFLEQPAQEALNDRA